MQLLAEQSGRGYVRAEVPEGIEKRIRFLDPADQKLLQLTLQKRLTRHEVGLLMGMTSGGVTRRIHSLLERLNDRLVKALADSGKLLPELYQEVGLAFFLRRESMSDISKAYGLSRYEVGRMLTYIRGWHKGSRRAT
jgi:hypothetical protein